MAELNTRARDWLAATGPLTGPEVIVGDVAYRAGDRVLAPAPDHQAGLVTSQRATVTAVNPETSAVALRTDDGRAVILTADQLGADRLGYAYSTTVHRCQGATLDRALLFVDGGGCELAYVAMSRARDASVAWVVADDPDQAADDLTRDWAVRRTPTWAIDTGPPDPQQLTRTDAAAITPGERTSLAAVLHARAATVAATGRPGGPPHGSERLNEAIVALNDARASLSGLADRARLDHHPILGDAARHPTVAQRRLDQLHTLIDRGGWWERRGARRRLPDATEAAMDADGQLQMQIGAEAGRLRQDIAALQARVDDLARRDHRAQERWHTVIDQQDAARRAARPVRRYLDQTRRDLDHPHQPTGTDRTNQPNHRPSYPSAVPEPTPAHEAPGL